MTGYLWAAQALTTLAVAVLAAAGWALFVATIRDLCRGGDTHTDRWMEVTDLLAHRPPPTVEGRPGWAWDAYFDAQRRHPAGGAL